MSTNKFSAKLTAAGLFGVAYSVDNAQNDYQTILELLHFCAICLEQLGFDPHAALDEIDDGTDLYPKAIERTLFLMRGVEQLSMDEYGQPSTLVAAFSRQVEMMLNLQLRFAGCAVDMDIGHKIEKAFSTPSTKN